MGYAKKLKDPRWQKKRLKILERDNFQCRFCCSSRKTLHVHHIYYGDNPWDVDDMHLVTLCEDCHEKEEEGLKMVNNFFIETLKYHGFTSKSFNSLSNVFSNLLNKNYIHDSDFFNILLFSMNDEETRNIIVNRYYEQQEKLFGGK